jgi:leader peptidase (prepilin peptidase)/N-methyltransferase
MIEAITQLEETMTSLKAASDVWAGDIFLFLELYPGLAASLVFLLGLCVGSFLNVCIVRFPKEESVVKGRSHCPSCGKTIAWHDNIPVLSFLLLRRACRHCRQSISWRYPGVELLTAGALTAFYAVFGPTVNFLFYGYFICSLIIVTFVDFEHQLIPDEVTLTGILAGLVASYFFPHLQGEIDPELGPRLALADAALGMLVGIGVIYSVALFGQCVFRKESMGGGDLKLLAMIGAFLGPENAALTFFLAPLVAAPIGIYLKWRKKAEVIPFGPYLAGASIVAFFWGREIVKLLLGF